MSRWLPCSLALTLVVCALGQGGCQSKTPEAPADPATVARDALVTRGKAIYMTACIACHAADPAKDGSLGPSIHGASRELLEARVLRQGYPEGYKPKRQTHLMPSFPQYKDEMEALQAFLNR